MTEIVTLHKCRVLYCGNTYTISTTIPVSVNDIVRVCAPCNNWTDLYVIENKNGSQTLNMMIDKINDDINGINDDVNGINDNVNGINKSLNTMNNSITQVNDNFNGIYDLFCKNAKVKFKDISVTYTNQSDFEYFKQTYRTHFPEPDKVYIGTWWHSDQEIYLCRFYTKYNYGGMICINCVGQLRSYYLCDGEWTAKNFSFIEE